MSKKRPFRPKFIDLTGRRFGRWLVISQAPAQDMTSWLCRCECGVEKVIQGVGLKNGRSTSCGCSKVRHSSTGTRLYRIWQGMLRRCGTPTLPAFKNYGARGISVSPEWSEFASFKAWAVANGYDDSLTIERMDNDGNYEPSNCCWIPLSKQAKNRRPVKRRADGVLWIDVAASNGISAILFNSRRSKGWTELDAATRPKSR